MLRSDCKASHVPWTRLGGVVAGLTVVWSFAVPSRQNPKPSQKLNVEFFESKVRPLLDSKCVACHGETQQSANLRLDRAVPSGMAKKIWQAVLYTGDTQMPPSGKLKKEQLAVFKAWTDAGAPWPEAKKAVAKKEFWAFVKPKPISSPSVKSKWWVTSELDRFILAKLEEKGVKPAPVADRRTLIRRATFDLTGLPPTPEEIENFINDKSPNAFEKVLDRLLATSAYGERWGRHWLDVARYADSNGLDENLVYDNAWRYRDWVVRAMNKDLPIDQFMKEQVAGDLMPSAGDDQLIATGYLAIGAKMLAEDDPVKQELDIVDEQLDTVGKTFLGLTIGCARCHDHKFDPISAKDYYSMASIFKSTKTMKNFRVVADWNERPIGSKEDQKKAAEIDKKREETNKRIAELRKKKKAEIAKQVQAKKSEYEFEAKEWVEKSKVRQSLKPISSNSTLVVQAEDFKIGNVKKDTTGYGVGIGVIHNKDEYPNRAEYNFNVPADGRYQFDLRYAAGDMRSLRVYIDGKLAIADAANQITGGFYPQHQKWAAEGVIELKSGNHTLKLERDSYFPHIDQWRLTPTTTDPTVVPPSDLIPEVIDQFAQQLREGKAPQVQLPENSDSLFDTETKKTIYQATEEIKMLEKSRPKVPLAMAVEEGKPSDLKVHLRGSYLTLGEPTQRKFLSALASVPAKSIPKERSGRMELAEWITHPQNPLTARVFVNRVWRWRFGRGIVASVDNFGALGDLPSHPELLDWLATKFVTEDKWSLKKLHKRMMLSSTYMMSGKYNEQAASFDPDNHLLWRFPRKRLEAEAIRDSIFFVAGKLDRTMGGSMMSFPPRAYVTGTDGKQPFAYDSPRRALYLPVVRAAVYDVYTAFDFGDPTVMNGDRPSTTIAPQALFMLNSPVVLNATKWQAERIMKSGSSDEERIKELYLTSYGRPATPEEVSRSLAYLRKFEEAYAGSKEPKKSAWQSLCKAVIAANEFIYVE
jgi:hypothetical protein